MAAPPHRQRHELPGDAAVLRAEPHGSEHQRAVGVLVVAGRGAPGGAEPDQRRVRHGAGRRFGDRAAAGPRLSLQARRDPVARRALPPLRRGRGRDALRQRRRGGDPAAAGRRPGRRRPDLRAHQGLGREQRRLEQGRLPGAERGRPGLGDRRGAGHQRGRGRQHLLCRNPRHRHAGRRSDRDGGADRGVPPLHRAHRFLRGRFA